MATTTEQMSTDPLAPRPTAAFFDLDKTIIATSSSMAFSRSFYEGGLVTRTDAIRTAYSQFLFLVGGADERQTSRLRDSLSGLIKGWEVKKVRAIVKETIHEHIDPVVYDEALDLIRRHHENGRDVIIVSASGSELVKPIAKMLGADGHIATKMESKKGKYTGEITFYAYGQAKADAIEEMAEKRGYNLARSFGYSDSITDAPMLNIVGHGFAVNPDRAMRRACEENGWGVLRFKRPVGLRNTSPARPAIATLVTVAVAVVAGILIYRSTKRER
ncbi:HAD family hydrolase [Demequina aurantiaca]|uniref:HAD family hydrolase n=1 Tax=Demequina aurantiaca TaxID=676200 RepID=UPI000781E57D|nr:HAD family hydrolase [Demequina aurantiaca]